MKRPALTLIIMIILWNVSLAPRNGRAVTRDEYTKQECATCHITWLDAFRTEDAEEIGQGWKPALIEETISVVTSEDMCFSCHDGFVKDSRQRVWEGKGHSVGTVPSGKVDVPLSMPLNQKGEVYCGTCHTPHGVGEQKAEVSGSVFLRVENVDSKLCTLCHQSQLQEPGKRNHPVNQLAREPLSQEIYRLGGRLGADPRRIICQSCHTPHGKGPFLKPALDISLCRICHSEKENRGQFLGGTGPLHPIGVVPERDLSAAPVFRNGARLGKTGQLVCLSCHGIHSGLNSSLVLDPDLSGLCQGCHPQEIEKVSAGKHNLLKSAPHSRNRYNETPKESGICRACHGVHSWTQNGPGWADSVAQLCLGCHYKGKAAQEKTIGPISHPIDVNIEFMREESKLRPLEKMGRKKVVCITCHNPHADRSYGQAAAQGVEPGETYKFLREERKILCGECHQDHFTIEGTKHDFRRPLEHDDPAIKKQVTQWGPCAGCHRIHRAKQQYQWALEPSKDVGPGSTMCGSCHNPGECAQKKPVAPYNHPLGVPYDGDTEQALPLVDTDSGQGQKIVACYTCHNPHQWSPDGSKGDPELEGSGLSSFLRMTNDTESRLCKNCHADKAGVEETDHDLRQVLEKAGATNSLLAGVCSGCHLVHSDDSEKKLWTQGLAHKGNEIDRACLGCHKEGKIAEKKPISMTHYTGRVSKKLSREELPLFPLVPDGEGILMTCATCHEPHRWSPGSGQTKGEEKGDERGEGTGKNSYLRIENHEDSSLCQDCHREKATIIGTEHDLRIMKKGPGQDLVPVRSGGVCSPCHAPHNFSSQRFLWARKFSAGANEEERMCFSCHNHKGVGAEKIPVRYSHPEVLIKPALQKAKAPLQQGTIEKGWKAHTLGKGIHCFVCHDAHQWTAEGKEIGPGRNVEGDAGSSFLWKKSHQQICTLCHGRESLYRYLYFHRWSESETP